ncbi:MAG: flagellar export chaperone FlgN [Anaerovoracaceae bacterium]
MIQTKAFNEYLDEFYDYLAGIVDAYDGLREAVLAQIDAVSRADISAMDENLKAQQALVFRIGDFEQRLAGYFAHLEVEAQTLTEFIALIPPEAQYRFYDILGRFAAVAQDVSVYKEQCRVLLEARIYGIDKILQKQGRTPETTYKRDASHSDEPGRILRTDI